MCSAMPRYAAFLRGMNLGRRRISNADLRAHVEALGFVDVATFRASGNVILTAPDDDALDAVARRLEGGLSEALAYDVPVFARGGEQVRAIAALQPFGEDDLAASKGKPQVMLLERAPKAAARRAALALMPDGDRFVFEADELHWLPATGLSDTELDFKALAQAIGHATVRTKGTIELIASKHFAP
jgi:uncharacterized protein (DUF1697 family)